MLRGVLEGPNFIKAPTVIRAPLEIAAYDCRQFWQALT